MQVQPDVVRHEAVIAQPASDVSGASDTSIRMGNGSKKSKSNRAAGGKCTVAFLVSK
jgi:hypothetical protein